MKILLKLKYLPLLVSLVCSSFSAELHFAKIFTDHVVLQRDMSVPVWGWAEPEVEVTVEFSSQKKRTTTDKTGRWMIRLDPMVANTKGQQLKVTAVGTSVILKDILVGEVWLASANLTWDSPSPSPPTQRKPANSSPTLHFAVLKSVHTSRMSRLQTSVLTELFSIRTGEWEMMENGGPLITKGMDSTGSVPLPPGLAMRYGFRRVYRSGLSSLILEAQSFIAGCPVNPLKIARNLPVILLSPIGIKRKSGTMRTLPGKTIQIAIPTDRRPNHGSSCLYNAMIAPIAPLAMRGVIWYQGESNQGRAEAYRRQLPTMVKEWRKTFKQNDLAFLAVQLPLLGKSAFGREVHGQKFANPLPSWKSPYPIPQPLFRLIVVCPMKSIRPSKNRLGKGWHSPLGARFMGKRIWSTESRDLERLSFRKMGL